MGFPVCLIRKPLAMKKSTRSIRTLRRRPDIKNKTRISYHDKPNVALACQTPHLAGGSAGAQAISMIRTAALKPSGPRRMQAGAVSMEGPNFRCRSHARAQARSDDPASRDALLGAASPIIQLVATVATQPIRPSAR
jgi:hypothetical protein